ncbi:MAG: type III-A CRISPR-associated protein Csm2 [Anaerolineae bacterium]|nr:type III-A CRISPR-associated protein Csm2 [Anaerolineae bacterium]
MSRSSGESFPLPSNEQLKMIITNPKASETLVKCADDIGQALAKQRLTTSQIRAIFGEVRRIEGDWKINETRANRSLILLKPKMAYRAKRESGQGVSNLVKVLDPAIDLVAGNEDNFTRFVDFFEAILAYHKAYGGN